VTTFKKVVLHLIGLFMHFKSYLITHAGRGVIALLFQTSHPPLPLPLSAANKEGGATCSFCFTLLRGVVVAWLCCAADLSVREREGELFSKKKKM